MSYESKIPQAKAMIAAAEVRTLEAIGTFIDGEVIVRCPVDTGNLRNSYTHKVDADQKTVYNGTNVEYAIYPEKGTSKMPAQPHLSPAAEENIERIKKLASEMMKID
jgi:HK97 gp10 family phage protein